jgi:hypothetical protein
MFAYMGDRFDVELEPEVREWLDTCRWATTGQLNTAPTAWPQAPTTLGEPYSKHLTGADCELRLHLGRSAWRVTYWLAPQRRVVLLAVLRKARDREKAEVDRAVAAQRICQDQHKAGAHTYDREG